MNHSEFQTTRNQALGLDREVWPHGQTGTAMAHGAIYWPAADPDWKAVNDNTKAIIILFRAFFLSQCKFFKKHEFIYTTVYGVAAALIIGIKNYMLYLTLLILLKRSINFFIRRDLKMTQSKTNNTLITKIRKITGWALIIISTILMFISIFIATTGELLRWRYLCGESTNLVPWSCTPGP